MQCSWPTLISWSTISISLEELQAICQIFTWSECTWHNALHCLLINIVLITVFIITAVFSLQLCWMQLSGYEWQYNIGGIYLELDNNLHCILYPVLCTCYNCSVTVAVMSSTVGKINGKSNEWCKLKDEGYLRTVHRALQFTLDCTLYLLELHC